MKRKWLAIGIILLFIAITVNPITGISNNRDDTTPPLTTLTIDPSEPVYDGWYRFAWVTLHAIDNESGVNATYYRINQQGWENYSGTFPLSQNGILLVQFYSVDNAGNEETPKQVQIKMDRNPPVTHVYLDPPVPNGLNGWYVTKVLVTINVTDNESGVRQTQVPPHFVPGGIYTEPFFVDDDGCHAIRFHSSDNVGNIETEKTTPPFCIDMTKPTIFMTYDITEQHPLQNRYTLTFFVDASDATSGLDRCEFYLNGLLQTSIIGPGPMYQWTWNFTELPNVVIRAIVYDVAGNSNFKDIVDPTSCENQQHQDHTVIRQILELISITTCTNNQQTTVKPFLLSFFLIFAFS